MAPLENVINDDKAQRCLQEGVERYPRFAGFTPRLVALPLRQGVTYVVRFGTEPPADDPDVWEFQNVVVKAYRRPD